MGRGIVLLDVGSLDPKQKPKDVETVRTLRLCQSLRCIIARM